MAPPAARAQPEAASTLAFQEEPAAIRASRAEEQARVLRDLEAGPPSHLSGEALDGWWARLFQRATALSGTLGYQLGEAWYRARGDNAYAIHHWSISQLHRGRIDEFRRLSEVAWRQARTPAARARFAATTASWSLAMLGDLQATGRWLQRAEDDLARANPQSPEAINARAVYLGTTGRWLAARGQFAQARRAASDAVERARAYQQAIAARGEFDAEVGRRSVDRALNDLIATQIDTGQHHDAQQSLQEAAQLTARERSALIARLDLVEAAVRLHMEQGRYAEAVTLARSGAARVRDEESGPPSARRVRMMLRLQDGLAASGQWAAAWDAMEQTERAIAVTPTQRDGAANPLVRGWVLLQLGRAPQALPVLEAERRRALALLGARSLGTALAGGLSAWALWESGRREEALARFDESLPVLLAPAGAAEDFMSRGLRQMIRRAVFEAYLRAAATPSQTASVNTRALDALRVVDHLMGASVQEALNDAALRSSVDPRLQDLLRREQDLRQRVNALLLALNRPADDGADTSELRRATAERLREANAEYLAARDALQAVLPREARADASNAAAPAAIAAQLAPGEVFVMLWPAADATYVWAVGRRYGFSITQSWPGW